MSNSEDVIEESSASELGSPSTVEDQMAALVEEMQTAEEGSSPSAPQSESGETEPDADNEESSEVEAKPEDEEGKNKEEPAEETIPKAAFLKRVNGLNAQRRKLETSNLEYQKEVAEYREAFSILAERVQAAEAKLAEYEDVDPRDQQLQEMQLQQRGAEIRKRLEAEHQQKIADMERKAQVESRADQIIQEAEFWADKYQTLTPEEIVYKFRTSDKSIEDVAKSLHDARYTSLKRMFVKENKPDAPKKLKPQGAMINVKGNSEDDMVQYLQERRS